jgi:hypothetical protein
MARQKYVTVEVTNQGAVYVNSTRVTGRETRWGVHLTVFETKCPANCVADTLRENNYSHIRLDSDYMKELGVV